MPSRTKHCRNRKLHVRKGDRVKVISRQGSRVWLAR